MRWGFWRVSAPQAFEQDLGNAVGGLAVPKGRSLRWAGLTVHDRVEGPEDCVGLGADKLVRAAIDRNWPLGIFAQRQAWNMEDRRLFLDSAAVGQNDSGVGRQLHEIQIARRVDHPKLLHCIDALSE